MAKRRHETFLWEANLSERFTWIKKILPFPQFVPTAYSTYCISFTQCIDSYQRKQFEEFLTEFYEAKKKRHQLICCWRELEVIVTVF